MSNKSLSFVERLREHAQQRPASVAVRLLEKSRLTTQTSTLTYAELDARARAVAAVMQAKGALVDRAERALLLLPTSLEFVSGFLGALYAGVVAVPAYAPESQRGRHLQRLAGLARDAQPRFVLTVARELPRLSGLLELVPELRSAEFLVLDEPRFVDPAQPVALAQALDYRPPELLSETLAFLQYTSGSSAAPKGVMVSHGNLLANEQAISHALAFDEHDVMVSWLPLFHDMGLIGGLLQPLFAGASVVLMSPLRFLERPLRWLEAITEYRGTVSGGPDFAYRMCVDRIEASSLAGLNLTSWRAAFCGSEPIRPSTLRAFAERMAPSGFASRALFPCYGLAEATLLVSAVKPSSGLQLSAAVSRDSQVVSCGVVPPEHTVMIAEPTSQASLPAGQVGEIWVSGPSVAQGYWQNAAASDAAFVLSAGQRWLRTGDLGFLRDGVLYIDGRLKDLIIVRGRNLVPQDIEDAVATDIAPLQVGRVAAFGIETAQGESIAIAAEVSRMVARTMRPAALCAMIAAVVHECVEEPARLVLLLAPGGLPRTSSGKLQRSACAQSLAAGELATLAVYRDGVLEAEAPRPKATAAEPLEAP